MNVIKHKGSLYDIVDIINLSGTYHLVIKKDNDITYINKEGDHYYIPRDDLSIEANKDKETSYLRKQYLLKALIDFITKNNISDINKIRYTTELFKGYFKDNDLETFIYWPLMDNNEFNKELKYELDKLNDYLEVKVLNKHIGKDGETVVMDTYFSSKEDDDVYVKDPSYKK